MSNFDDARSAQRVRTNLLGVDKPKPSSTAAIQLIVPQPERVAEGEHVKVTTIDGIRGLASLPLEGAIAIPSNRILDLLVGNADLFEVALVKLVDYPGVEYTPEFERATWDLPTVSYNELLADLAAEKRRVAALGDQAGARQAKPKREQVLDRQRENHFSNFVRASGLHGAAAQEGGDNRGDVDPAP